MLPWSQALPTVSANGAVYVTLRNHGEAFDRLVGASSPMANRVELHGHSMKDGVMTMRPVESIVLAPGKYVTLEPGGNHLMLFGLKKPLKEGEQFPLTLEFEKASSVEVVVTVQALGSKGPEMTGREHHGDDKTHDHVGKHEHPHDKMLNMPAVEAPTLELAVEDGPSGGYTLRLTTTNFRFSEEHADADHIPGEGHGHFYIDGEKIGRVYGTTYEVKPLLPGMHEIDVGLFTNNHMAYAADGWPVSARVMIRVLEADDRPSSAGKFKRIDLMIHHGKVDVERKTVRITEGDLVELRWSSNESRVVHLHGYDIETEVTPSSPVVMRFDAVLTGRFPVEAHGGGHGHKPLLYLEVYPK